MTDEALKHEPELWLCLCRLLFSLEHDETGTEAPPAEKSQLFYVMRSRNSIGRAMN